MRTLEQTFHELTALIADQTRDLAMAMAELRNVAAERDKAVTSLTAAGFTLADGAERWKPPVNERMGELYRRLFALTDERDKLKTERDKALTERDDARAGYKEMNTRIYGPGGECFELDKARAERDKFAEALQRNCVQYVEKQQALIDERDKLESERDNALAHLESLQACLNSAAKAVRVSEIDANTARQSLRAAEQDVAETESVNSDLRGVNKRLVADLAAATQRADTAEAILRAKA